jgi:type II secretory pathway component PulF
VATTLREGDALSSGLASEPVFAPLLAEMAAIGERTGRLAEQLQNLARLLDDELETATDRIIALLPPLLTVLLGGIIGGIVMTITSAILSVNDVVI